MQSELLYVHHKMTAMTVWTTQAQRAVSVKYLWYDWTHAESKIFV